MNLSRVQRPTEPLEKLVVRSSQQIVAWLRNLRHHRRVSARAVQDATGIDRAVITRMENGRRRGLRVDTLIRVCDALGADVCIVPRDTGRVIVLDPCFACGGSGIRCNGFGAAQTVKCYACGGVPFAAK